MAEILSPQPGQVVVTTKDEWGHHRDHHRGNGLEYATEKNTEALLREQASGFRVSAQNQADLATFIRTSEQHTTDAVGAVGDKVMRTSAHTDEEMCEGFDAIGERLDAVFSSMQKQISDGNTATVVGFKDAQAIAYQLSGQSLLEAAKNANALSVQATANANAASVQATMFANASTLQAQTLASAALIDSTKNAAAIAAQVAECCCELKERISGDGDKTRALINAQDIDRLRDRAARAEQQLAAYYAAKAPPVVP